MITNIPDPTDYQATVLSLLNLAWETTLALAISLEEAQIYTESTIEEQKYWAACQTHLATSISLVQQAAEFLLKSKIATVSPFLLLNGTPRDWPRSCDKTDTPFSDFLSIDAQDLIRAHDTVLRPHVPEDLKQRFIYLRRLRNRIVHTVDKKLILDVKEVVVAVLLLSDWFIGPRKWISCRKAHIENSPHSIAYQDYSSENETYQSAQELMKAIELLSPKEAKDFFGFDKKQRRYVCYTCAKNSGEGNLRPRVALLLPNTPTSTNLYCFLCEENHKVARRKCKESSCKGNVKDAEDNICLTCMH